MSNETACANETEINSFVDRVSYELWVKEEKENFRPNSNHYKRQVLQQDNRMTNAMLTSGPKISFTRVYIRPNYQEIEGQLFQIGDPSYSGTFYDVSMLEGNPGFVNVHDPNLITRVDYVLAANGKFLSRQTYCLNNLFGDLGGVNELLTFIFSIFLLPLSRHSFIVDMLETNFRMQETEEDPFQDSPVKSARKVEDEPENHEDAPAANFESNIENLKKLGEGIVEDAEEYKNTTPLT